MDLEFQFLNLVSTADWKDIYQFCQKHKVEILLQDDQQYHCFIDYKKGDLAYGIELDPISALICGVHYHQKENQDGH